MLNYIVIELIKVNELLSLAYEFFLTIFKYRRKL